jgi:hypothetical protein
MHEGGKIQQNPCLLDIKGHFRHGSNENGPMKSNILIGQELSIGPKAF